jgi:hypothetical protein
MSRATIVPVPILAPLPLTSDELCLLDLFRAADHRGKFDIIRMARCALKVSQKYQIKPSLRLVVGGES